VAGTEKEVRMGTRFAKWYFVSKELWRANKASRVASLREVSQAIDMLEGISIRY